MSTQPTRTGQSATKASGGITVDDVTMEYPTPSGPLTALQAISFDIPSGVLASVVGASGCGKSTLLKIIAGLLTPTRGTVTVGGATITRPVPEHIAVVFQEDALLPWYRIQDNVALGLAARRVPKAKRREAVAAALEKVGLSKFERAYPHELSGGMRQRAALARALVLEPQVLLLDEPFASLDEQTRNLMGQELRTLHSRIGGTMVMVTHSLTEAVLLSDRVVALSARPGRLRQELVIDLPDERSVDLIDTQQFGDFRHTLWQNLQEDWLTQDAPADG
ncbi:MAG TPA: ABC transporter ATP-binding protein [Egibacteraceae bacterium]|nr:ABC transporter ATP-binding protein [Egibacteraceae bacterium]